MEPLVSIIMPVYGVEAYLEKAVRSVQSQSYANWELLAMDDGSKDRSGQILDALAAEDARIHALHQENAGAPAARNAAMEKAQGKYYYFMDADDWVEPTMLADMVALSEEHHLQLAVAGYYIDTYYTDDAFLTEKKSDSNEIFSSQRAFREAAHRLFDRNLLYTPWNKLFLREYVDSHGIRFRDTFWDDFPFVLDVIRDAERIGNTDRAYYHFVRKRRESETSKYRPDVYQKREEEDAWMRDLYAHWHVTSLASREVVDRRYVERVIGVVESIVAPESPLTKKEQRVAIRRILHNPRLAQALKSAKPQSGYSRLMWVPLRMKSVLLTYAEGKVISYVKHKDVRRFARLKANR